jgi:excisionase family DNA binding protein
MTKQNEMQRRAFALTEVATLLGRHRSWVYRMVREGKIRTIKGFGNQMVSAAELDRILGSTNPESHE